MQLIKCEKINSINKICQIFVNREYFPVINQIYQ